MRCPNCNKLHNTKKWHLQIGTAIGWVKLQYFCTRHCLALVLSSRKIEIECDHDGPHHQGKCLDDAHTKDI